ncbi:MAG: hypothetical protein RR048_06665, partial [Oscillospiraceae bacterium]
EIIGKVHISRKPIPISELTKNINVVLEENGSKKIQYKMLTQWLIKNEYLDEITLADGKTKKELTPKSQEIGITSEHRTTQFTSYDVILYSSSAQEFILHNLQVIVNEYEKPTPTPKKAKPSTIEEWTTNEEKQLLLEYSSKLTIAEISTRHNRTPKEIEDRLTLLGKI